MVHIPRWKVAIILGLCALGVVFALPNALPPSVLKKLPEWMTPVKLGLDLQGGSHLLLEVDVKAGVKDRLSAQIDAVRGALRDKKYGYKGLSAYENTIRFKVRDLDETQEILRYLSRNPELKDFKVTADDQGRISLVYTEEAVRDLSRRMVEQSIQIVERRINEYGTAEPYIQSQGDDRILLQLPGVDDPGRVKELLGKTAKMTFRLVHRDADRLAPGSRPPAGTEWLENNDEGGTVLPVYKQILISGENLMDAQLAFDQDYGRPQVSFRFDAAGSRKFASFTAKNIGRRMAIVLDGKVLSAPVIQTMIPGHGVITGNFSPETANDLALLMRSGALPAPLTILEERSVGPELGADSIAAGESATVYAIILVAVSMLLIYSFLGIVANVALVFNLILLMALLSIIGATLTLPGIAGIALTLGMAVDANVLIYERVKEEIKRGKKILPAIETGYTQAMNTIVDSNLTTLIAAAALFFFGSGGIRGFAVTLSLGILVSMFTAISLTRVILVHWIHWKRPTRLSL